MVFCSLIASSAIPAFISALKVRRCLDFISAPFPTAILYLIEWSEFWGALHMTYDRSVIEFCDREFEDSLSNWPERHG